MIADAIFNFVQIIIDLIQALESSVGGGGIGAVAAGA
jgi:hypothetical protein